ncbi:hypothetical protein Igag_1857 [Ignisphaera aggregans DSM 17230]|uniref:Uncharacterized protein n=1 Tax=Ignisphaera aggregans (strain DSM 17230 / JCM 13409 / AQ1.S1) TaxID=583356 RepID=E0SSZ1_IGNAA|nr:hypothetical protein Igag_1857 [Ignisphaera aggregans DSM 17230]
MRIHHSRDKASWNVDEANDSIPMVSQTTGILSAAQKHFGRYMG